MKILVIGASGLVGGNCLNYFQEKNVEVLGTHFGYETPQTKYFNTLDLDDPKNEEVKNFRPDVVVHCGALTHVDYCEDHVDESFQKTVVSTQNAVKLAAECGAKFVFFSTDYVFNGKKGFYSEEDEPNPLSVYGQHKLDAELAVQNSGLEHIIIRITNVFGDEIRGKNFIARLIEVSQSGEKAEWKVPIDQYATPVNAAVLAQALFLLLQDGKTGIYHIGSTDYLNRYQLAMRVKAYFPSESFIIKGLTTEELNQKAARPLFGGFNNDKFISEYPDFIFSNIDDYLRGKLSEAQKNQ